MKDVIDFLTASPIQFFATIGLDGTPKVRPFQFMLEHEGRLYFCTSNQKNVYKEMQNHPDVELSATGENFSWIRLKGRAVFSDDLAVKAMVQKASPLVKSIYQTPDNPVFEIFYLDNARATIADFSGNPPKTIAL